MWSLARFLQVVEETQISEMNNLEQYYLQNLVMIKKNIWDALTLSISQSSLVPQVCPPTPRQSHALGLICGTEERKKREKKKAP